MVTMEDIREKLNEIFNYAEMNKLSAIAIRAGNLHKVVNPEYKNEYRVHMCCNAMRDYYNETTDEILYEPPSGQSTSLEILFKEPFPRRGK